MAATSSVATRDSTLGLPRVEIVRCTRHATRKPKESKGEVKETKGGAGAGGDGGAPAAAWACLTCAQYLCPQCNKEAHTGADASHYRFPTDKLKSYIAFDAAIKAGESHIRRGLDAQRGPLLLNVNGVSTLYENFHYGVKVSRDRPCLGTRTVVAGKIGPYAYQTYGEVAARLSALGAGLKALGITAKARVGIYSVNRPEWVIAEQACYAYNFLPVPLYDTLGADAAEQVILQAGLSAVVCSQDKIPGLLGIATKGTCPAFTLAVIMPLQAFDKPSPAAQAPSGSPLRIVPFGEVERLGTATPVKHEPPLPSDLATLCYTSGTTGTPKGAMLTHANIVSNAGSAKLSGVSITALDSHVSYLPLAHMYERLSQANIFSSGGTIGFARGDPLLLLEDIEEFKPTIFAGVPRLYNRLYDKVMAGVDTAGGIKKLLFTRAFNVKRANLHANGTLTHGLYDKLVFSKIAARLGGRCRLMITGSAPIAAPVMDFLRIAFSCPVVEGYGQTEGSAAATITLPTDQAQAGTVGVPLSCVEIKLVDVPEMNYTSKDIVNGIPAPRGEIWVHGSSVFQGYYKDVERTREALSPDRWLLSGDIGMWTPDGQLKIIDRKKNIFKLAQGEYIAPEKIENVYVGNKFVAQIYVHGDSLQTYLVAIVVPDEEAVREWAKANKIAVGAGTGLGPLLALPQLKPFLFSELQKRGKEGKLQGFEQVRAIHLFNDLFTVGNGLLTPTFKLKREHARKVFEKEITALYAQIAGLEKEKAAPIKSKL